MKFFSLCSKILFSFSVKCILLQSISSRNSSRWRKIPLNGKQQRKEDEEKKFCNVNFSISNFLPSHYSPRKKSLLPFLVVCEQVEGRIIYIGGGIKLVLCKLRITISFYDDLLQEAKQHCPSSIIEGIEDSFQL